MAETTVENWAHETRKQIDACIKSCRQTIATKPERGGREIKLAHTKLQEAKMWLGKVLEECGSKLPEEYRDEA